MNEQNVEYFNDKIFRIFFFFFIHKIGCSVFYILDNICCQLEIQQWLSNNYVNCDNLRGRRIQQNYSGLLTSVRKSWLIFSKYVSTLFIYLFICSYFWKILSKLDAIQKSKYYLTNFLFNNMSYKKQNIQADIFKLIFHCRINTKNAPMTSTNTSTQLLRNHLIYSPTCQKCLSCGG